MATTEDSTQQLPNAREDLISDRMANLLMEAARRADEGRFPFGGDFLRENEVSSDELFDLMQTVRIALKGFAQGGKHIQSLVLILGASDGELDPGAALKGVFGNFTREEFERYRQILNSTDEHDE